MPPKMTLDDIQRCLLEAFDGDYMVARAIFSASDGSGLQVYNLMATSESERKGTEVPPEIVKQYLHCGGCSLCQGMRPDED